jgi:hypothetical protein
MCVFTLLISPSNVVYSGDETDCESVSQGAHVAIVPIFPPGDLAPDFQGKSSGRLEDKAC